MKHTLALFRRYPLIGLFAILFLLAAVSQGAESLGLIKPTPKATTKAAPEAPNEPQLHVGDDCTITEACYGAVSEQAFEAVYKAVNAKDPEGINELIVAGLAVPIQPGTKARLLEHGVFKRKIRLLSGDFSKEAVYVPREFVAAPPSNWP